MHFRQTAAVVTIIDDSFFLKILVNNILLFGLLLLTMDLQKTKIRFGIGF